MVPYVGQIMQIGCQFVPLGFLPCDGALYPISDYTILYALIGTTYGGDGASTFAVPNLIGRVAIHAGKAASGNVYGLGQWGGTADVTLTAQQIPTHGHTLNVVTGNGTGTGTPGSQAYIADEVDRSDAYASSTGSQITMDGSIASGGGSEPHSNMQPVVANLFCIAYVGIFPNQT
ncbi:MAG: phage tail protein [Janthinobacterium lividum]